MTLDARLGAWLGAWSRVEAANKMFQDHPDEAGVGVVHDVLMGEARILADLANAPESVGLLAGAYLEQQEKNRKQAKEFVEEAINRGRNT